MSWMSEMGRTLREGLPAGGGIVLSLTVLLIAWGCGSGDGSDGDGEESVSGRQLSIVAMLWGEPVPDATVTVLDDQGNEVFEFPQKTNERGYIPVTVVTAPLPRSGFVVRGCPEAEDWCLYHRRAGAPRVAAGMYLTWGTTWSHDPFLVPPAAFKASAGAGAGTEGTDTALSAATLDQQADPLPPGGEQQIQAAYDPAWATDPAKGLTAALSPETLLSSIAAPQFSMGLRSLYQALFPEQRPVVDQLHRVDTMLHQLHVDLDKHFDEFMRHPDVPAGWTKEQFEALQERLGFIHDTAYLLRHKLHDLEGKDEDTRKRELGTFIEAHLAPQYEQFETAVSALESDYADIFPGLKESDSWWIKGDTGGFQRKVYSVDYSNRVWGTYVTFLSAHAAAHDLTNRLYIYYMNEWSDTLLEWNAEYSPDPTRSEPNPVNSFYMQFYNDLRRRFLDTIETGIPRFLVLDDHTDFRRVVVAPYITKEYTINAIGGHVSSMVLDWASDMGSDSPDIDDVLWKFHEPTDEKDTSKKWTDVDQGKYDANLAAMRLFTDWRVGKYAMDQYLMTGSAEVAGVSIKKLLSDSGVLLGGAAGLEQLPEGFFATDMPGSRPDHLYLPDPYTGSWAYVAENLSYWQEHYPVFLQCFAPIAPILYLCDGSPAGRPYQPISYDGRSLNDVTRHENDGERDYTCVHIDRSEIHMSSPCVSPYDCTQPCDVCIVTELFEPLSQFCGKGRGQYGNYDYDRAGLPLFGVISENFPTNIARDYNSDLVWGAGSQTSTTFPHQRQLNFPIATGS